MTQTRNITRGKYSFEVLETSSTTSWNFWGLFANTTWEKTTFVALDSLLEEGDLLFDIGAWVGPISLWEAKRGIRVIAFEPDPGAFDILRENIELNGMSEMIIPVQVALVETKRMVELFYHEQGDSKSRVWDKIFENSVMVQGDTLLNMIETYGMPKAIKMDIEGGEALVIPVSGQFLRDSNIPLVLSLHTYWYPEGTSEAMSEELSKWEMKDLSHDNYLCTPLKE